MPEIASGVSGSRPDRVFVERTVPGLAVEPLLSDLARRAGEGAVSILSVHGYNGPLLPVSYLISRLVDRYSPKTTPLERSPLAVTTTLDVIVYTAERFLYSLDILDDYLHDVSCVIAKTQGFGKNPNLGYW